MRSSSAPRRRLVAFESLDQRPRRMEVPLGRRDDLVVDDAPGRKHARGAAAGRAPSAPRRSRRPAPSANASTQCAIAGFGCGARAARCSRRASSTRRAAIRVDDGVPVARGQRRHQRARRTRGPARRSRRSFPPRSASRANAGSLAQRRAPRACRSSRALAAGISAVALRPSVRAVATSSRCSDAGSVAPPAVQCVEARAASARASQASTRLAEDVLGGQRLERRDDVAARWRRHRSRRASPRSAGAIRWRTAATGVGTGARPIACGQSISSRHRYSCTVSRTTAGVPRAASPRRVAPPAAASSAERAAARLRAAADAVEPRQHRRGLVRRLADRSSTRRGARGRVERDRRTDASRRRVALIPVDGRLTAAHPRSAQPARGRSRKRPRRKSRLDIGACGCAPAAAASGPGASSRSVAAASGRRPGTRPPRRSPASNSASRASVATSARRRLVLELEHRREQRADLVLADRRRRARR